MDKNEKVVFNYFFCHNQSNMSRIEIQIEELRELKNFLNTYKLEDTKVKSKKKQKELK